MHYQFLSSFKKTYRLFSLFMAAMVAISISLPVDLIAAHCSMDSPIAEMAADHCPMTASHQHQESYDQHEDCDWILSCACDINKTEVKPEAVPSVSKHAKTFVVSVIQFLDSEHKSTPSFLRGADLTLYTEFPPIFLLNSVFLN